MPKPLPTLAAAIFTLLGASHEGLASPAPSPAEIRADKQAVRFGTEAEVVTVDVVVLDESGDPVEGLTPDDFTITDEGRLRPVSRFEAVTLARSPASAEPGLRLVSTNTSAGGPSLRTFVVVFDDVHMGRTTARRARDAVREFVGTLREGDRLSLVPTSGGAWWHARLPEGRRDLVGALRRLVGQRPRRHAADRMSDHEAMRLHLHRDPWVANAVTRRYEDNGIVFGRPDPSAALMPGASKEVRQEVLGFTFTHPFVVGRAAEVYYDVLSRRQATYGALQRVAATLEGMRGRKSILFVSEGFIQEPGLPEHRDMVKLAQRANVVVHFLDARGLVGLPASADVEMGPPTGGRLADHGDVFDQMNEPLLESLGAVSLAVDTGGRVIRNANDLARGLRSLERESRAYYLLGFEPTDVEPDGTFHELDVSVARPGVEVLARKGYFAPSQDVEDSPDEKGALDPRLRAALDSPFDADALSLRMLSYDLGPADGKTTVLVVADIDPRALSFEERDGRFEDTLTFHLVVSHRDSGARVHRGHQVELSLPTPAYEQMQRTRLPLMIDLPLAPGRHQARLLVRDERSGAIGTVRHDLVVPAPDAFRVSTPILTDVLLRDADGRVSPRPLARRTFLADRTITLLYRVHGADASLGATPHVVGGFRVESTGGAVVATGPDVDLRAGPDGDISQMATISLAEIPTGLYALVVNARDEVAGRTVETRALFRVAPRPGAAAVEETVAQPGSNDVLERVRGYIVGWGEGSREP